MSNGYVLFAYAHNNHGAVTLPHWQEDFRDGAPPVQFIDAHGGQPFVPRNVPANFAYPHAKPAQAAQPNFGGIAATRPPSNANSYYSNAWRWKGPTIYANQIVSANLQQ